MPNVVKHDNNERTKEEKISALQVNPFDPHDMGVYLDRRLKSKDEVRQGQVVSPPTQQSVLQIGTDPDLSNPNAQINNILARDPTALQQHNRQEESIHNSYPSDKNYPSDIDGDFQRSGYENMQQDSPHGYYDDYHHGHSQRDHDNRHGHSYDGQYDTPRYDFCHEFC